MQIPLPGRQIKKIGNSYFIAIPAQFVTATKQLRPDKVYDFTIEVQEAKNDTLIKHSVAHRTMGEYASPLESATFYYRISEVTA